MMDLISQWWPLLLLIPFVCLAIVALVFPQKIMRFLGRLMNPLGMDDDSLDRIPMIPGTEKWLLGGRSWSEFLNTMKENPEEFRYRLIWFRIVGFLFLIMVLFTLWLLSLAIRSGALIM